MFTFLLRDWCEDHGVTISDVAREAKQTLPLVRRYWYEDTASYDRESVALIVDYLRTIDDGVTVADLFTVTRTDEV